MSDPNFYIPKTQKGIFGNISAWVFAIIILVLLAIGAAGIVRWVSAPTRGKLAAREQINSGSYRIQAYDHFFNLCASIQGLEGQLDAQLQEASSAKGDDLARVQANIAGIRGAREQAIAEYNADSRKSYTLGQFRASDLPYQIQDKPYEGSKTSCTAG